MSERRTVSRSETVRQRRRSSTPQARPARKTSRSQSGYRELPPITARGIVNDFAIERRKKAGKRRFNAVISLPRPIIGAISLPRIRLGWRFLSAVLVLLFGVGLYLFWTLPDFRVNNAQISGNQRIAADEINTALDLNGRPIFLLTPSRIREQTLQAYPELASVEVTIDLPNLVTVNVTEREPVIQWMQNGGYTWIDKTGTAFRPRGEAPGAIIVQALGNPPAVAPSEERDPLLPAPFISEDMVAALSALAPYVPAGTPILYDPATGFSWTDARGWQAVFGSRADNMEVKIRVYQAMVDWLTQRSIRPILINVAYPSAPFYRVEQAETQVEEQ